MVIYVSHTWLVGSGIYNYIVIVHVDAMLGNWCDSEQAP